MKYSTVYSLFADRVKNAEPKDVFYFRSNDQWQGISWQRFEQETFEFATALLSHGLERGGSVCILMGNVPEWPISDIGTIMAGGVGVGIGCRIGAHGEPRAWMRVTGGAGPGCNKVGYGNPTVNRNVQDLQ